MLKAKNFRTALIAVMIFSLVAVTGYMPAAKAATLESASDTISDSDLGASATHVIVIDMGDASPGLDEGDYININFAAEFDDVSSVNATCPAGTSEGGSGNDITCTVDAGGFLHSTSTVTHEITVESVTNPDSGEGAGAYNVTISTHQFGGAEIESTIVKVYVMEDVTVSATVESSLAFSVATTSASYTVAPGVVTTGTSSPDQIAFSTLEAGELEIMGQDLTVSTNASNGYTVTVFADGPFDNGGGADIDAFSSSTPAAWVDPTTTVDINDERTYGYWGVTSNDDSVFSTQGWFQGLKDDSSPLTVMAHNGPVAANSGTGIGSTTVAYAVEITAVQEAGDYDVVLTYVCTPTY